MQRERKKGMYVECRSRLKKTEVQKDLKKRRSSRKSRIREEARQERGRHQESTTKNEVPPE